MDRALKTATRYNLVEFRAASIIFFAVIFGLYILSGVFTFTLNTNEVYLNISGNEMACIIFVFIMGLCTVRESFQFSLQNNVSRHTIIISKVITTVIGSLVVSIISRTLPLIATLIFRNHLGNGVNDFYQFLFSAREVSIAQNYFEGILYMFAACMLLFVIGYVIGLGYYRMGKLTKTLVSIIVPAVLVVLLPAIDLMTSGGAIYGAIFRGLGYLLGLTTSNPYLGALSMLLLTAICWIPAVLLWRRLPLKP